MNPEDTDKLHKEMLAMLEAMKVSATKDAKENPRGWRGSTVATYYNEQEAAATKIVLDSMVDGKDKLIRCANLGIKAATLRSKIYQSWSYLIDNSDPEGIYQKLRANTETVLWPVKSKNKEGVVIHWSARNIKKAMPLEAEDIEPLEHLVTWRDNLDKFMDTAEENDALELTDLALSEEEFIALKESIDMTDDFVWSPKNTKSKITILRSAMIKKLG